MTDYDSDFGQTLTTAVKLYNRRYELDYFNYSRFI